MIDPGKIIKDSSIWRSVEDFSVVQGQDTAIRIGVIKAAYNDIKTGELRYLVEVQKLNDKVEINCRIMRRFGGVYNYEDFIGRGYKINQKPDPVDFFEAKAGDAVLVALLNGQGREGIILGGINHVARTTQIKAIDGPQYKSEFNGIETYINKNGEYTITFKGQPTNLSKLDESPSNKIAPPQYDLNIGTTYLKLDKTGSFEVSDNSKEYKQFIKIDKPNGTIELSAGNVQLKMNKKTEESFLKNKITTIKSAEKISIETKQLEMSAQTKAHIKSPKIAIGKEGVELLDQLSKLIDALGAVQPISPIGPCTPLKATPQWSQVEQIKAKIKEITGTF
jgi:hypothetical protein